MSHKSKGINAERELIHLFWDNGWASVRIAGSGSMRHPSVDILAANKLRKLAIECKTTKNDIKYLSKEEIDQLKNFSDLFGAEPWIGIKFNNKGWYFLDIHDLEISGKMFYVDLEIAKRRGLLFEEFIGNFNNDK